MRASGDVTMIASDAVGGDGGSGGGGETGADTSDVVTGAQTLPTHVGDLSISNVTVKHRALSLR